MLRVEQPGQQDYPLLLELWEASVRATHHFLTEADIQFFKKMIREKELFSFVELTVVRNESDVILGFSGVADGNLEMLFIHPNERGKGIGKLLAGRAIRQQAVTKVDVNEQNPEAVAFYQRMGFEVISRSELDSSGKPFPVLHMQLRHSASV